MTGSTNTLSDTGMIDAHQHFYDPDNGDYPWLWTEEFAPVRHIYTPADLQPELDRAGVVGTVLVQTWSSMTETQAFLELASTTPSVLGVVGWVDLTSAGVAADIDALLAGPGGDFLVGLRHQVHDEPDDDWLLRDDVNRGLAAVEAAGLVYDLLIRPRHLAASLRVVRSHPQLRFVIDHIAKPRIRIDERAGWRESMALMARCPNVFCKVSGLVTEADWSAWDAAHLGTYVTEVVDLFGADRVLFGSDWPVCLVAASYAEVLSIVTTVLETSGSGVIESVMRDTAIRCYGLQLPETIPLGAAGRALGFRSPRMSRSGGFGADGLQSCDDGGGKA